MNKKNKGILIGLCIGDGYITNKIHKKYNYIQNSIVFYHCAKQKEYIDYKAELLLSVFGGKKPNVVLFNNNGYPGYRMMKTHKYFKILRELLYKDNHKLITRRCLDYLTPQGLAIWYMDDGNLAKKKRNGKIHAYELYLNTFVTDEEHDEIINYFKEKWDINFSKVKNHNGYRLRCGTKEARKFIKIIDKYVIPSMKYKTDISNKDI
jgi:hypothetical protein